MSKSTICFFLGLASGLGIGIFLSSEEKIYLQKKIKQQTQKIKKRYKGPMKENLNRFVKNIKEVKDKVNQSLQGFIETPAISTTDIE